MLTNTGVLFLGCKTELAISRQLVAVERMASIIHVILCQWITVFVSNHDDSHY